MKSISQNVNIAGSALLEVLITLVILAFGMLGVAGLQARVLVLEFESYQRAQAVVILNDIAERIAANTDAAATYVDQSPLGLASANCTLLTDAARDVCEIGNTLNGASETAGATKVGAMTGGRACISSFTDEITKSHGRCQSGVQIDIAWRGKSPTIVPFATCGQGQYGNNDAYRRVISTRVATRDDVC